jgi:hypothetical protein
MQYRHGFAKLIWKFNCPQWDFDDASLKVCPCRSLSTAKAPSFHPWITFEMGAGGLTVE